MFQRLFLHVSLVFEYLPLFWSQGRFMTSCKGTWISHFHYPELSLKLSQLNFHVSTFISWRVISLCTFSRFMTSCKGTWISHFHYMSPELVLRLKLSQCTNFHVSTFISSRVISVWIFAPILVPGEIYDVMQGDMNFTFSLYESRIEFSV